MNVQIIREILYDDHLREHANGAGGRGRAKTTFQLVFLCYLNRNEFLDFSRFRGNQRKMESSISFSSNRDVIVKLTLENFRFKDDARAEANLEQLLKQNGAARRELAEVEEVLHAEIMVSKHVQVPRGIHAAPHVFANVILTSRPVDPAGFVVEEHRDQTAGRVRFRRKHYLRMKPQLSKRPVAKRCNRRVRAVVDVNALGVDYDPSRVCQSVQREWGVYPGKRRDEKQNR